MNHDRCRFPYVCQHVCPHLIPCSSSPGTNVVPRCPPAPVTNTLAIGTPLLLEITPQFSEPRLLPVLFRKNCFALRDGAGNPHVRVVPLLSAVIFRRVVIRHLVKFLPCQRADAAASFSSSASSACARTIFVARQSDSNVPASVHPPSMTS